MHINQSKYATSRSCSHHYALPQPCKELEKIKIPLGVDEIAKWFNSTQVKWEGKTIPISSRTKLDIK